VAPGLPDPDDPLLDRLREALRGEYDVERRLGAGGMGYVYLGRDPALDMPVAIKVLRPEIATALAAERFLTEARVLAAVKHVNVVTVHRVLERHGLFLYVMELLGDTLAERLRGGPLRRTEAVRLGMDLLAGLERVHELKIVHRDIKPGNIFVQERGPAKIGDFGIAHVIRPSGDALTETGGVLGTPAYMPPELKLPQGEVGPQTDLYPVAMVAYEALTGRGWQTTTVDPAQANWRGVPRRIRPILQRGLAVDPAARWPDARTFRHALGMTLRRRTPAVVAVLAVVAAVAAIVVAIVTGRPRIPNADIAVLPFTVTGGSPHIGENLAIYVQKNLAHAWGDSGLRVTPENLSAPWAATVGDTAQLPPSAWSALHATYIVRGSVTIRGDSIEVAAQVLPRRGSSPVPGAVGGPESDRAEVGRRLAYNIVRAIRPSRASQFEGWRVEGNPTATDAFVQGEHAFERDNWAAAEAFYRIAIGADSAFADAWWGLYKVQSWRRATHEVDLAAVYARDTAKFGELDRLLIRAELAPTVPERIALYTRAVERAPYDAYPRLMLGNELFHRGALAGLGFDSAISVLDSAAAANPYLVSTYSMLAWVHIRAGNAAQAQEALEKYATYGRPQPEEDFSMLDVLQLAWAARFAPDAFAQKMGEIAHSPSGLPSLAQAVRLGLAFGIPNAQASIGHELEAVPDPGLRVLGLTAQIPALLSEGQVAEALAHLEESARASGDQEYTFQAAQWTLILPALEVPGVPPDARVAARTLMRGWAAAGQRVARARWTLLLDALATDTSSADRLLTDLAEAAGAPALVDLGTALLHAVRGDTAGALQLSDSLTLHVVAAEVADPLQRAVLFLSRGRWLAGRDRERADAAWRWYENADFVGWPQGYLQAAELDWALETYARYLRAGLAREGRHAERACVILPDAVARWAWADSTYATLRATLDGWARACAAS
jgi:tetratricopeptide (TPR) repeat protein